MIYKSSRAKYKLLLALLLAVAFVCLGAQQAPKEKSKPVNKYVPTEAQSKDLEIARLNLKLSKQDWDIAASQLPQKAVYQKRVEEMDKACTVIRTENKWPNTVQCFMPDENTPIVFGEKSSESSK